MQRSSRSRSDTLRVNEWVKMLEDAVYRAEDLLDKSDTWQRKMEADAKVKGKSKVNGYEVRNKKNRI